MDRCPRRGLGPFCYAKLEGDTHVELAYNPSAAREQEELGVCAPSFEDLISTFIAMFVSLSSN